jgi:hypothetical protein
MIKRHKILAGLAMLFLFAFAVLAFGQQQGYFPFNGNTFTIRSGATQTVASGGIVDFASGSTLQVDSGASFTISGTTVTTSNLWTGSMGIQQILADSTLTSATSGKLYYARPVAAKTTITLPGAAAGLNYTVFAADADSILITTASGDSLLTSAGVAWKTTSTVAGTIKLIAYDTTRWVMLFTLGTWTSY